MEKRVLLAIALCVGIIFAWQYFLVPHQPAQTQATGPGGSAGMSGQLANLDKAGSAGQPGSPAGVTPAPTSAPVAGAGTVPGSAPGGAAAAPPPERRTTLESPVQRFVFSNRGAGLQHAQLREGKYLQKRGDPSSGLDVVAMEDPARAALRVSFPDSKFPTPGDAAWETVAEGPDHVVYRTESGGARIEKHFRLDSTRYRLHLDVTVENRSAAPLDHHLAVHVFGKQDPEASSGFFSGPTGNTASVVCHVDDKTERVAVDSLEKDQFQKVGAVRWVAADQKFFLLAAVPYPETPPAQRQCAGRAAGAHTGEALLSFSARQLPPGARTQYAFTVFVGPKIISDLEEVRPGGQDVKLAEAVDVTLAAIARPMLWFLKQFYGFTHNWGVAIILLTVFIRILTFYPTQRSLLSAKKMQKLGPKMAAIRKKYENDKQRQSVETMSLYKAHGVSPIGGCLPSLIQMPIWIALYSTLNYAVELYRSPFILHITDLTAKDPFYVTPLLMGGVMFVQMKMSPTSPDKQQQAMMAVMMPVMFTAFSLVLPAGLAVYMLTSYLIGILQQLWVNRIDRKANPPQPTAPAKGGVPARGAAS